MRIQSAGIFLLLFPLWISVAEAQVCPNADTKVTRTVLTQKLLLWLKRDNPTPALGGHWTGSRDGWTNSSKPKNVGWDDQKEILGKEPLIFGFEYIDTKYIDALRFGPTYVNVQGLSRADTKEFIINKAKQGGIITVVDHMPNFVTQPENRDVAKKGDSWDVEGNVVERILPGGSHHGAYKQYLDDMADYFRSLTVNGEQIPILFRPFHEINGKWFWWGNTGLFTENGESKRTVVKLWRFTWNYLTHCKGLRNIVWVWSANIDYNATVNFLPYWPGPMYVDVVALDGYINEPVTLMLESTREFSKAYKHLEQIASSAGKLPIAISEFGFNYTTKREAMVWKSKLPNFLNSLTVKPSYMLVWGGPYGPLGTSYLNEAEKTDDKNNFKNFVITLRKFLLLGEKWN